MNQPPQRPAQHGESLLPAKPDGVVRPRSRRRPAWRLPAGVAPGTWEYTQQESIASGYRDFIAQTPLVGLDSELMLKNLPSPAPRRGSRVIDFGCGDGRTLQTLWDAGFDVLGVDLSQPMLRQVAGGQNGDRFGRKLIRANLVQLGCLADAVAEHGVCLFSTIGMIRGRVFRRQFLRHAARIIRPGGTLVLHVHNRNAAWRDRPSSIAWLRSALTAIGSRQHELGDRTYGYRGLADMFLHTYSLPELKADLVASRWQIQNILPLSLSGGELLSHPRWIPGLRAGGFIAIATRIGPAAGR